MNDDELQSEIATAAASLTTLLDRELFAAGEAFVALCGPPTGPLSQAAAARWLGLPRRTLRSMIERRQLRPAEDGALIATDLQEQLARYRARADFKKGRRQR